MEAGGGCRCGDAVQVEVEGAVRFLSQLVVMGDKVVKISVVAPAVDNVEIGGEEF